MQSTVPCVSRSLGNMRNCDTMFEGLGAGVGVGLCVCVCVCIRVCWLTLTWSVLYMLLIDILCTIRSAVTTSRCNTNTLTGDTLTYGSTHTHTHTHIREMCAGNSTYPNSA